jgi:hypothetical protein
VDTNAPLTRRPRFQQCRKLPPRRHGPFGSGHLSNQISLVRSRSPWVPGSIFSAGLFRSDGWWTFLPSTAVHRLFHITPFFSVLDSCFGLAWSFLLSFPLEFSGYDVLVLSITIRGFSFGTLTKYVLYVKFSEGSSHGSRLLPWWVTKPPKLTIVKRDWQERSIRPRPQFRCRLWPIRDPESPLAPGIPICRCLPVSAGVVDTWKTATRVR